MNKSETYNFDKKNLNDILLKAKKEKLELLLKLLTNLKKIHENKQLKEKKKYKPSYSEEDIDFLKELSAFELTKDEAYLTGKQDEYYDYLRLLSDAYSCFEPSIQSKLDEELKKIDDNNITPRLVMECFGKFSTKRKK